MRVEFFGDDVDAMGRFDPVTQRRTENIDSVTLLPAAEVLPGLCPGGEAALATALEGRIAGQKRRKTKNEALLKTLAADLERLTEHRSFSAWDRYLALIYPKFTCAAGYLPEDATIFYCDQGALHKSARAQEEDLRLSLKALLEAGTLDGGLSEFRQSWDLLSFSGHPVIYLDSFLAARYPEQRPPKELLSITAKQLPSYGGNLETAASDLQFYGKNGFRTLVLCGSRRRAEILQGLLRERHVSSLLAFPLTQLPRERQILLSEGSLPSGMEYPAQKLARPD